MPFQAFKAIKKNNSGTKGQGHDHDHKWGSHKKQSVLQKYDTFGTDVNFNIDGQNKTVNTGFGGILTLLSIVICLLYTAQQIMMMYTRSESIFISSDYFVDVQSKDRVDSDENHSGEVNMLDFEDTFNFIIGSTNKELNLLNNEYMNVVVYEVDQTGILEPSKNVILRPCNDDDKDKFIPKKAQKYYPNALCFEDKSKINLYSNWFSDEYKNLMVMIEECVGFSNRGLKCATSDDVVRFSKKNVFYLIRQETLVDPSIYYDDAVDFKDEDSKTYFPLRKVMRSEFYDSLDINTDDHRNYHEGGLVDILEISLGINQVTIDDAYLQLELGSEKSKQYIDVTKTRMIKDSRDTYSFNGKHPLMVFYFGVFNHGKNYRRLDVDVLGVLGNVGGLMDAILVIFGILCFFFTEINVKAQIIDIFDFLLINEDPSTSQHQSHNHIQTKGFQLKYFCFEKVCCKNPLVKCIARQSKGFQRDIELYDEYMVQIEEELSMTKVMKGVSKIEKQVKKNQIEIQANREKLDRNKKFKSDMKSGLLNFNANHNETPIQAKLKSLSSLTSHNKKPCHPQNQIQSINSQLTNVDRTIESELKIFKSNFSPTNQDNQIDLSHLNSLPPLPQKDPAEFQISMKQSFQEILQEKFDTPRDTMRDLSSAQQSVQQNSFEARPLQVQPPAQSSQQIMSAIKMNLQRTLNRQMDLKKEIEQKKKEIPGFNKRDENGPDSSSSFNSDDPDKEAD